MPDGTARTSLIGRTLGSYKIVAQLGQGGMASVYQAYQEAIDRSVAIKVMPAELLHDPNFLKRFVNEARTLARLQHPSILPLYDFGEIDGLPYIVMPLMSGGTLADRITHGPITPAEAVRIIGPIAEALDYAHSQGLLHRDIKPNNILFDARGAPVLADFGIAKSLENPTGMTGTGIIGTPDYMSPEQARGETLDYRADIYALAVVVYYMLTGQRLFQGTTPMAVLFKHVTEPPRPLRQHRPSLSSAIEAVVMKSLAKNPADRHRSAAEFIRALAAAAQPGAFTQPVPPPVSTVQPPRQPTYSQTSPVQSPVTGTQFPVAGKKSNSGLWITVIGIAAVAGLCALGGFGAVGLGMFGIGSAAATSEAATARAVADQQTQEAAQLATQTAFEAQATAIALSEPINRGAQWPLTYADDFASDSGNWSIGDVTGSRATGQRQIAGGVYQWIINGLDSINLRSTLSAMGDVADFYYVIEGRQASGPSTADYGPVFRVVSDRSFYYFAVSESGLYSFYKLQSNSWTVLIDYTESSAIIPGGPNRVAVVGEGSQFTFYINDVRVADYVDDTFSSGEVGVAIQLASANQRATFEFDNVELHTP